MPVFAEAQPCLLAKLVTQLKLQILSHTDHVSRKGDIIGSAFDNIFIVNIPASKTGNHRTTNIQSVGY
ncbi:unnamed protein product [Rotaria socialis]|uniref:Uncharacterized protein n=1 Tax=Rotaria socialis TaxID=392032 RepID=A0A819UXS0_9BILA|nr:unnamed protein product [Rotaria socialis]CAF4109235.1 unnamed protein product [Rotaria socialis]